MASQAKEHAHQDHPAIDNSTTSKVAQGLLVVLGAAVLAFGGFVAASPSSLGTGSRTILASTGPVTLARLTTLGTTPTVITDASIQATSSTTTGRSTDDTLLGTILGVGTLLLVAGAFYRRVTSVAGFGITVALQAAGDPATQKAVADKIKQAKPDLTPDQAIELFTRAMERLGATSPETHVTVTKPVKPYRRLRLSMFAARSAEVAKPETVEAAVTRVQPSDEAIDRAVASAADDLRL
jgi:hypothetical protein